MPPTNTTGPDADDTLEALGEMELVREAEMGHNALMSYRGHFQEAACDMKAMLGSVDARRDAIPPDTIVGYIIRR